MRDTMPHAGDDAGVYYALGYCGSGVARATYLGHKIAQKVLGDAAGATAWDAHALRPFLFPAATRRLMPLAVGWYRLRDKFDW